VVDIEPVVETKGTRTKRRIIDAAIPYFAAVGPDAASIPEIARRVGISHSAIYQHFGSKEALYLAAVDADLTSMFEQAYEDVDHRRPLPKRAGDLVTALAASSDDHPLACRILKNPTPDVIPRLDDLEALLLIRDYLLADFVEQQRQGEVRGDLEPERTVDGVMAIALSLLSLYVQRRDAKTYPRAKPAVDFLVKSLSPERPRKARTAKSPARPSGRATRSRSR
jgi:AcrR family transcriptional regulator